MCQKDRLAFDAKEYTIVHNMTRMRESSALRHFSSRLQSPKNVLLAQCHLSSGAVTTHVLEAFVISLHGSADRVPGKYVSYA
jgi:hypothetical protein